MAIFSFFSTLGANITSWLTGIGLSKTVAAGLVSLGRSLIFSGLSLLLQPKPPRQQVQAPINQAAAPRIRAYGRVLLGGVRAFWEAKSGTLHQIVVAHHGPIHGVAGFLFDGSPVEMDSNGMVTGTNGTPAANHTWIHAITSGDGGDYAELRSAFPALWTEDHRLAGQATYYVRMRAPKPEWLSKIFPRGAQAAVQMICDASAVCDPRTDTVAFSENGALCLRDYLTSPDGMRIPAARMDDTAIGDYADLCDEAVDLKGGGTEPRYAVAGYYSLEEEPKSVVARLALACDADIYLTAEGKVAFCGGEWTEPDVTIGPDDILSMTLIDGPDEMQQFNVLKGVFISPDHRWQPTECHGWRDEVALAAEGEKTDTLEAEFVKSHTHMQRLLKIHRARNQPRYSGVVRTNLVGLKARLPKGRGVHTIRLLNPELNFDQVVRVTSHSYSITEKVCEIGFASVWNGWAWDPETEEGPAPPPLAELIIAPSEPVIPDGLTPSLLPIEITGGVMGVGLVLTVTPPEDESLELVAEFKPGGFGDWQAMVVAAGAYRATTPLVADGLEYEMRARWRSQDPWSAPVTILAVANQYVPAAPTSLALSEAGGTVTVSWVNAMEHFHRTRVYRGASPSFGAASILDTVVGLGGQPSSLSDAPGAGTWYYWAITLNSSQVESSPAGPVSVTI